MCKIFLFAVDSNVPIFDNCPVGTKNFGADEGSSTAVVTWPTITATDDMDSTVTITSNYLPGETLAIGTYTVVYQAVDSNGNIGYCQFNVVVAGNYFNISFSVSYFLRLQGI